MAKFKVINVSPPQRLLKNINIRVGARNLGEKDFEIMLGKGRGRGGGGGKPGKVLRRQNGRDFHS